MVLGRILKVVVITVVVFVLSLVNFVLRDSITNATNNPITNASITEVRSAQESFLIVLADGSTYSLADPFAIAQAYWLKGCLDVCGFAQRRIFPIRWEVGTLLPPDVCRGDVVPSSNYLEGWHLFRVNAVFSFGGVTYASVAEGIPLQLVSKDVTTAFRQAWETGVTIETAIAGPPLGSHYGAYQAYDVTPEYPVSR